MFTSAGDSGMASERDSGISRPRTIDEVLDRMVALLAQWDRDEDYRAVFLRSYRIITEQFRQALRDNVFEDSAWMESLDVRFAEHYFRAIDEYSRGKAPQAWQIAFDLATAKRSTVLQDLILGMNAHIQYDLPIVLYQSGLDERALRRRDHQRVNALLRQSIDQVQRDVSRAYAPYLGLLDRWVGRADEIVTFAGILRARARAWDDAVELSDAPSETERERIRAELDHRTAAASRVVAKQKLRRCLAVLRRWL